MAKDSKKLVQAITSQEENFAQWYTDICVKAELVEYSSVKGFIILRPYGQAIWELIQKDIDARFKATGHENVAMPVLIPESLLQKEGELVNGFAPEVAWVTMGGSDKLEERLAVRPTSETMFCDHWSRVLHSYRELPMKYNQWCHETAAEAEAETQQQLNCYADVCEQDLAIPVVKGRKTDKEKFAGAEATYTIEAMMKDGKALQSGTSHYFGDKFSKAYDVTFTGRDNQLHHPFQTSWGVSTRLVGAIIMTHGDDDGLILPPAVAPIQVVVGLEVLPVGDEGRASASGDRPQGSGKEPVRAGAPRYPRKSLRLPGRAGDCDPRTAGGPAQGPVRACSCQPREAHLGCHHHGRGEGAGKGQHRLHQDHVVRRSGLLRQARQDHGLLGRGVLSFPFTDNTRKNGTLRCSVFSCILTIFVLL